MQALTIHEAARDTGWSARMLRYVERTGLVVPERSPAGYRLYGPGELQRLRTLKELLARFELGLSDVAFAARLARRARSCAPPSSSGSRPRPRRPEDVARRRLAALRAGQAPEAARRGLTAPTPIQETR